MTIFDTHLHVIDRARLSYPWLSGVPALDRDWSYADYAMEARRVGIADVLHMEVDVSEDDIGREIAMVAELAARPDPLVRGALAACRPESPDFPEFLEACRSNPIVKGFRRVLHVMPDDLSEGATFRENIARLKGTGLPFDMVVLPHQIPKAIALADLAPDVSFILDHCGVPAIAKGEDHPWRAHIAEIAKRPNVSAKISGVVAYADAGSWTVETLRPYVEHVIENFGWTRVVWGSDWPVVTLGGSLSTWVAATHALISGCSPDERRALLSENARRIWSVPA